MEDSMAAKINETTNTATSSNNTNSTTTSTNSTKETTITNKKVSIEKETPSIFLSKLEDIKKDAYYRDREMEKTIKNPFGSISVKKDGSVSASSGYMAYMQLSPDGIMSFSSPYNGTKTNIHSIDSGDYIFNNHKLNNKLYELADFKKVLNGYSKTPSIAGGLTMLGTVLVRAWEPNLKRYVLVRRLINIPMFSPAVGGLETPPGIKVTPNTDTIKKLSEQLNTTGLTTYTQLSIALEEKRKQAILAQEEATTKANEAIKTANAQKQATSMTTLTGQVGDGTGLIQNFNISPSAISNSSAHGGGGGSFTGDKSVRYDGTANDMAKEAWTEAQRIAKDLNIDPTIIYGQWYHESGGFSSKLAMENCNLGGLTQTTPNGEENKQPDGGNYYMKFNSIHDYAEYFKRVWGPDIKGVSSAEQYASNLKREGYYGDSYENYVSGIYGGMKHIPSSLA